MVDGTYLPYWLACLMIRTVGRERSRVYLHVAVRRQKNSKVRALIAGLERGRSARPASGAEVIPFPVHRMR